MKNGMTVQELKLFALDVANSLPSDRADALAILRYASRIHSWTSEADHAELHEVQCAEVIPLPARPEPDQKLLQHETPARSGATRFCCVIAVGTACFAFGWLVPDPPFRPFSSSPAISACASQSAASLDSTRH